MYRIISQILLASVLALTALPASGVFDGASADSKCKYPTPQSRSGCDCTTPQLVFGKACGRTCRYSLAELQRRGIDCVKLDLPQECQFFWAEPLPKAACHADSEGSRRLRFWKDRPINK